MKKVRVKGTKGINKGASSGLVISILVHLGAFVLAGALVLLLLLFLAGRWLLGVRETTESHHF